MKKQMISVIVLCAGLLSVQAQDKNGGISPEMLGQIRQSYQDTASDKALRNAIGSNSINCTFRPAGIGILANVFVFLGSAGEVQSVLTGYY